MLETDRLARAELQRYRPLLDALPIIAWTATPDGEVDYVNATWTAFTGLSVEEASGEGRWLVALHPDDAPHTLARWEEARATGEPYEVGYRLRRADGAYRWHLARVAPLRDGDGRLVGWLGTATDSEDQHRRAAEAERALQRLGAVQAAADAALANLATPDLPRALLARLSDALGVDNAALLIPTQDGRDLLVYLAHGPEQQVAGRVRVPIGEGIAGRIAASREPLVVDDLSTVTAANPFLQQTIRSLMGVPLLVGGRLVGVLHAGTVTLRRFTEDDLLLLRLVGDRIALALDNARLYAEEQQLRARADAERRYVLELFRQTPAMIAVHEGPEHRFSFVNTLFERVTGRSAAELIGRTARDAFPEVDGQDVYERFDQVYRTGEPLIGSEVPIAFDRDRDGALEEAFFTFAYQPLRDEAGAVTGILQHAVEVTDQMQARRRGEELTRQVREERDRLQQVIDVLPEAVLIADATPTYVAGNRAAREVLGLDLVGRPMPVTEEAAHALFGARHLDGTPLPSSELPLLRALWRHEVVRGDQFRVRRATDGRDVPLLANAAPLRDGSGAVVGAVVAFQDITALLDLERAREEFLSSAAHDLKGPLTSIQGLAQLAQRRLNRLAPPEASQLAGMLEQIVGATRRMVDLIDELIDVTRAQMGAVLELDRQPVDLVALVREAAAQQERATQRRIVVDAAQPELQGLVDGTRVERVMANLLSNAIKYSPNGAPVAVRIWREEGEASPTAVIAVRDEGIGIPAADLPHIFERFRRAGNVYGHIKGTGIGLASAKQIVELHGGTIDVESAEGRGSTFTVRLPLQ